MAEDTKTHWGRNASKNPFKPKAKAAPPPPIFLPQVATPGRESFNTMDFGPSNRATSMSAIRGAFNNSNPANYSTVDPFTTAPLVDIKSMPGIGNYGAPPSSLDPSIDLNTLNPQFENIVIPPNSPLIPPPRSSADPQQLLAEALQRRAQQTAMDVELRKQQQLEQGIGGDWPSDKMSGYYLPYNTSTSSKYITDKVPEAQLRGFERDENGTVKANFTKNVPGIGHVTKAWQKDGGEGSIMTGRYGTGSATFSDKPRTAGATITEDGQKVPIAYWFKDAARRQGEGNRIFDKNQNSR